MVARSHSNSSFISTNSSRKHFHPPRIEFEPKHQRNKDEHSEFLDLITSDFTSGIQSRNSFARLLFILFLLFLFLNTLVIYVVYVRTVVEVRVVSLNMWAWPWVLENCKDKHVRIDALADGILNEKISYDILFLQGLWMKNDYLKIKRRLQHNLYISGFKELSSEDCTGQWLPFHCSGLVIISKFPIDQPYFEMFPKKLRFKSFVQKGFGMVTLSIKPGINATLINTHFASNSTCLHNCTAIRQDQVDQLSNFLETNVSSQVILMAGSLNEEPGSDNIGILKQRLIYSLESVSTKNWQSYTTFMNDENTYTDNYGQGKIYDYVFYASRSSSATIWTNNVAVSKIKLLAGNRNISLSNHDPVVVDLSIRSWSSIWPFL